MLPFFRELIRIQHSASGTSNKLELVEIASARPDVISERAALGATTSLPLPSLVEICLMTWSRAPDQLLMPHLEARLFDLKNRYECVACRVRLLPSDPHYLSQPLRERIIHFDPPIFGDKEEPDIFSDEPRPIKKTHFVIGGRSWRFCAPCLYKHCVTDGCLCMICKDDQRAMQEDHSLRWARRKM